MKHSKWIGIGVALFVVILVVAILGINKWYHSGNVRISSQKLRADLSGIGYIVDPSTGEITGQTPIGVKGECTDLKNGEFFGQLEVLGFVNETEGTITTTMMAGEGENGFWEINCIESCLHYEVNEDGYSTPVDHICDYIYTVYIHPDKQDFMIVLVDSFDANDSYFVVLAGSEAEALETYRWFEENK